MNPLRTCARPRLHAQRGVTLIVALIMLGALGLLAAWAVKSGTTNLVTVSNTQARQEAFAAAQAAVEVTLSQPTFSQQPAAVASNPIGVDLDGDGVADAVARLTPAPACYRWRAVKVTELDPAVAADLDCLGSGSATNAGIDSSATSSAGNSLCADSEWNVRATVTDPNSGASVAVNQGVALRGLVTDVVNACP